MTAQAGKRAAARPRREARHGAREAAVQMLYQWEVGRNPIEEVAQTFWMQAPLGESGADEDGGWPEGLREFATALATGVVGTVDTLDPIIAEAADNWRIERMAIIDRLILRLAVHEFLAQPETPARVVINEALELARTFSTDDAVRFINGILDSVRKSMARE